MRKQVVVFTLLTLLAIGVGYVVKSRYYYFPYPNLIECVLLFGLGVTTLVSLLHKNATGNRAKLVIGLMAMAVLMGTITCLNWTLQWHRSG